MEITLTKLSTKNLATLAKRVITISDKPEHAIVQGNPLLAQLKTAGNVYDTAYTKDTYSGLGPDVANADRSLDTIFRGIKQILLGNIHDTGSVGHQESMELYAVIEKYGTGLDHYSYSEETAQMAKLIEELDQPDNVVKLDKVHLSDNFIRLKAAEINFVQLFGKQVAANAALRQIQSASSIRSQLESSLRNYFNVVSAMRVVDSWKGLDAELAETVKAARNSAQSPALASNGTATTDTAK
jgi:hypothetical protein